MRRPLIIGAGPIGLATLEFVKLTGTKVIVLDVNETRLQFCHDVMGRRAHPPVCRTASRRTYVP